MDQILLYDEGGPAGSQGLELSDTVGLVPSDADSIPNVPTEGSGDGSNMLEPESMGPVSSSFPTPGGMSTSTNQSTHGSSEPPPVFAADDNLAGSETDGAYPYSYSSPLREDDVGSATHSDDVEKIAQLADVEDVNDETDGLGDLDRIDTVDGTEGIENILEGVDMMDDDNIMDDLGDIDGLGDLEGLDDMGDIDDIDILHDTDIEENINEVDNVDLIENTASEHVGNAAEPSNQKKEEDSNVQILEMEEKTASKVENSELKNESSKRNSIEKEKSRLQKSEEHSRDLSRTSRSMSRDSRNSMSRESRSGGDSSRTGYQRDSSVTRSLRENSISSRSASIMREQEKNDKNSKKKSNAKKLWIGLGIGIFAVAAIAVGVVLYLKFVPTKYSTCEQIGDAISCSSGILTKESFATMSSYVSTTSSLDLGDFTGDIEADAFDDFVNLQEFKISDRGGVSNPKYKATDGVLYSADGKTVVRVPMGYKGSKNDNTEQEVVSDTASVHALDTNVDVSESGKLIITGATRLASHSCYGLSSISKIFIPKEIEEIEPGAFGFTERTTLYISGTESTPPSFDSSNQKKLELGYESEKYWDVPWPWYIKNNYPGIIVDNTKIKANSLTRSYSNKDNEQIAELGIKYETDKDSIPFLDRYEGTCAIAAYKSHEFEIGLGGIVPVYLGEGDDDDKKYITFTVPEKAGLVDMKLKGYIEYSDNAKGVRYIAFKKYGLYTFRVEKDEDSKAEYYVTVSGTESSPSVVAFPYSTTIIGSEIIWAYSNIATTPTTILATTMSNDSQNSSPTNEVTECKDCDNDCVDVNMDVEFADREVYPVGRVCVYRASDDAKLVSVVIEDQDNKVAKTGTSVAVFSNAETSTIISSEDNSISFMKPYNFIVYTNNNSINYVLVRVIFNDEQICGMKYSVDTSSKSSDTTALEMECFTIGESKAISCSLKLTSKLTQELKERGYELTDGTKLEISIVAGTNDPSPLRSKPSRTVYLYYQGSSSFTTYANTNDDSSSSSSPTINTLPTREFNNNGTWYFDVSNYKDEGAIGVYIYKDGRMIESLKYNQDSKRNMVEGRPYGGESDEIKNDEGIFSMKCLKNEEEEYTRRCFIDASKNEDESEYTLRISAYNLIGRSTSERVSLTAYNILDNKSNYLDGGIGFLDANNQMEFSIKRASRFRSAEVEVGNYEFLYDFLQDAVGERETENEGNVEENTQDQKKGLSCKKKENSEDEQNCTLTYADEIKDQEATLKLTSIDKNKDKIVIKDIRTTFNEKGKWIFNIPMSESDYIEMEICPEIKDGKCNDVRNTVKSDITYGTETSKYEFKCDNKKDSETAQCTLTVLEDLSYVDKRKLYKIDMKSTNGEASTDVVELVELIVPLVNPRINPKVPQLTPLKTDGTPMNCLKKSKSEDSLCYVEKGAETNTWEFSFYEINTKGTIQAIIENENKTDQRKLCFIISKGNPTATDCKTNDSTIGSTMNCTYSKELQEAKCTLKIITAVTTNYNLELKAKNLDEMTYQSYGSFTLSCKRNN